MTPEAQAETIEQLKIRNDERIRANNLLARRNSILAQLTIVLVIAIVVMGLSTGVYFYTGSSVAEGINQTTENTNDIVRKIEDQTSPEAQAAAEERLDGIIIRVDCNNRRGLQDALDALTQQGLIDPVVVTANCPPVPDPGG